MSTIVLPAVRGRAVNLYRHQIAGHVVTTNSSSASAGEGLDLSIRRIVLAEVGILPGEVISGSAEVMNHVSGENTRATMRFYNASHQAISNRSGNYANNTTFSRDEVSDVIVPSTAVYVEMRVERESGAGDVSVRKPMINRGPTAAPHEWPKRGAWAPITHGQLVRDNEQFMQRYLSGASQITTFPSRRWLLQFATHILEGDELREWSLALDRLSDLTNVFHFVPPEYTGPSTGYEGPLPVVNGAGQLGTSLDCDGVTPETDIVGPGDYVSFPVTTSAGQTNYELHRISSLCTSDESGEVTLEFTRPIRLAPANNAVVQIYAPIGQFRLAVPRAGQDIQLLRRASVSVEAEEAIWL